MIGDTRFIHRYLSLPLTINGITKHKVVASYKQMLVDEGDFISMDTHYFKKWVDIEWVEDQEMKYNEFKLEE